MVLIDTSCWIHQMRPSGNPVIRARVERLLLSGQAAWCAMVRLELWSGVNNDLERRRLRDYEAAVIDIPVTQAIWVDSMQLASRCRAAGVTAHAADLLIAACALHHRVAVETADADFDRILAV